MILTLMGILTWALLAGACAWYVPLIVRGTVQPPPATWIIAAASMNVAAIAAWNVPGRTLIENVTLYAATAEINVVFVVLVVVLTYHGKWKTSLDWFQWLCLGVMVVTVFRWIQGSGSPKETFWTIQGLFVVAYIVTAVKAVRLKCAFDSIGNWACICTACVAGIVPALIKNSPYGIVNSTRGMLSAGFLVGLLMYFDLRKGKSAWAAEVRTNREVYRGLLRALRRRISN